MRVFTGRASWLKIVCHRMLFPKIDLRWRFVRLSESAKAIVLMRC